MTSDSGVSPLTRAIGVMTGPAAAERQAVVVALRLSGSGSTGRSDHPSAVTRRAESGGGPGEGRLHARPGSTSARRLQDQQPVLLRPGAGRGERVNSFDGEAAGGLSGAVTIRSISGVWRQHNLRSQTHAPRTRRDRVVAPIESLRMANALIERGHRAALLTVHQDLGHNVWTRIYAGEDFYAWLLSHALDGK
jgi:hypothetical protein